MDITCKFLMTYKKEVHEVLILFIEFGLHKVLANTVYWIWITRSSS